MISEIVPSGAGAPGGLHPTAARLADALLWVTAALGGLTIAVTALCLVAGYKPLIVQSGSMAPSVPVGSVAIVAPVGADDLGVGDVVWTPAADGTRVLHRVAELTRGSEGIIVRLKGDANEALDAGVVTLRQAPRLRWVLPGLGYAASAASTPFAGAAFALLVVAPWLLRRPRPEPIPA